MSMSSKKKILAGVVGVGALVFVGALAYALIPTDTRDIGPGQQVAAGSAEEKQLIEAGRYVAVASDCIACHTAGNGKQYAGGRGIESPIGTMYATNITPDKNTGIGNYSLNDFDRAVRHGIKPGGGTLYPSMPYPSYAKMSDGESRQRYPVAAVDPLAAVDLAQAVRPGSGADRRRQVRRRQHRTRRLPGAEPGSLRQLPHPEVKHDERTGAGRIRSGIPVGRSADRRLAGGQPARRQGRRHGRLEPEGHRRHPQERA